MLFSRKISRFYVSDVWNAEQRRKILLSFLGWQSYTPLVLMDNWQALKPSSTSCLYGLSTLLPRILQQLFSYAFGMPFCIYTVHSATFCRIKLHVPIKTCWACKNDSIAYLSLIVASFTSSSERQPPVPAAVAPINSLTFYHQRKPNQRVSVNTDYGFDLLHKFGQQRIALDEEDIRSPHTQWRDPSTPLAQWIASGDRFQILCKPRSQLKT